MRHPPLARALAAALLLAAVPSTADADDAAGRLRVDWALDGSITGGALAMTLAAELAKDQLAPASCRWCEQPGLDRSVRDAVVWSSTSTAATLSDVLVVAVPAGVTLYDVLASQARSDARLETAAADALLIAEAMALTALVTDAAKLTAARLRPYAYYGTDTSRDGHLSFWSGHTSVAFAAAASGGMVAQLRGYGGWPWVYGLGFSAAAATGYFRMAGDKHWLTDVLSGAAVGTAVGLAVPLLHRASAPAGAHVVVTPRSVGLAGHF